MTLRHARVPAGLAVALAVATVAAALVRDRADEPFDRTAGGDAEIEARATLSPRVVLFGDTVRAHIDVVLDKSRVDPGSVRVAADVAPFEIIHRSDATRGEFGDTVVLRTTLVLRCAAGNCVPSGQSETYDSALARISFAAASEQKVGERRITTTLPSIRVYSRFAALSSPAARTSTPWQADLLSLPPVSYRFDRGLLVALLLAGATLAALAGLVLAYRARPRRPSTPAAEPEPDPLPALNPLELALALLERSIVIDGAPGRRRALELVAEELEHAEWGDPDLAGAARALAWSEDIPAANATSRLAARVRSALPREHEAGNGGGGAA